MPDSRPINLKDTATKLQATGITWGWGNGYTVGTKDWKEQNSYDLISKFFGILLTAVAASMGAPFWFDMLNKLINIRAVGKSPVEKEVAKAGASSVKAAVVKGDDGSVG
jgi:hypothetical protein